MGYYNGRNSNTTFEPKHLVTWYNPWSIPGENKWITESVGYANRESNVVYSIAGVLEEIQYPTGGKSTFEYEPHTAIHDETPRELLPQSISFTWQTEKSNIDIQLYDKSDTKVSVTGFYFDSQNQCKPRIYLKNTLTNVISTLSLDGTTYPKEVYLEKGNYNINFKLIDSNGNQCSQSDPAAISLKWNNESSSPNSFIGGLRIKSISDYSDNNVLSLKRNFSYHDDINVSTGRITNAPKYYGLIYDRTHSTLWTPIGYKRYVNSTTPLATTQGSHVGYGKVTVSKNNSENGKTEYYYTTTEDYPDIYNAINPSNDQPNFQVYDGVKIYPYPLPEIDSKDFLRGALKREINYKKNGSTYTKAYEKLISYDTLKYSVGDFPSIDDYIKNAAKAVRGLKVYLYPNNGGSDFTYYDIYTGYNLDSKIIEKQYNDTGVLTQISEQKYDADTNGIINHYIPISNEIVNSDGEVLKINTDYIFNKSILNASEQDLESKNALYIPIQKDIYKNNIKSSSSYTIFDNNNLKWPDLNLPESVQTSKGNNTLEDRIIYHDYDDKGNPLEVSKKDGAHIVYVWGYDHSKPIAKIENAKQDEFNQDQDIAITNAITASDNDTSEASEDILRQKLNDLRDEFGASQVTTYTYDLLVGVTSITDPSEYTSYYVYDDFNRLQFIKDKDGNVLRTVSI